MTEYRTLLSNFIKKSTTVGLLKNDGTVDTTDYVSTSNTEGLIKNDGTIDTTSYLSAHQDITGKEDKSNKVTSISSSNTDTQYPSAKCVNDMMSDKVDMQHRAITTFIPSTYGTTTNANFTSELAGTISANGAVEFNYTPLLQYQEDYLDFTLKAGADNLTVEDGYDTTLFTIPANTTYHIHIGFNNTVQMTVTDTNNDLIGEYYMLSLIFILSSGSATSFSYGNRKWNHIISWIDRIYPVGAIYMSMNSVDPSLFIGGVWEQIEDCFLLASGSTYSAGSTGGSANAVVVTHTHTQNAHRHTANSDGTQSFLTAPTGSAWSEDAASALSGSGNYYPYSTDSSHNVWVAQTANTTATNQNAGESGTGKNMPPYLTVYMWKRIG